MAGCQRSGEYSGTAIPDNNVVPGMLNLDSKYENSLLKSFYLTTVFYGE